MKTFPANIRKDIINYIKTKYDIINEYETLHSYRSDIKLICELNSQTQLSITITTFEKHMTSKIYNVSIIATIELPSNKPKKKIEFDYVQLQISEGALMQELANLLKEIEKDIHYERR